MIPRPQYVKIIVIQEFDAADAIQVHLFYLIREFDRSKLRDLHSFQNALFDLERGLISSIDHQTELRFLHAILADADLIIVTSNGKVIIPW